MTSCLTVRILYNEVNFTMDKWFSPWAFIILCGLPIPFQIWSVMWTDISATVWILKWAHFVFVFEVLGSSVLMPEVSLVQRIVLFSYCCFFKPVNETHLCSCAIFIAHFDRKYKIAEWINTLDGVEGSCLPPLLQRHYSKASAGEKPASSNLWISSTIPFSLAHVCKILQKSLQFLNVFHVQLMKSWLLYLALKKHGQEVWVWIYKQRVPQFSLILLWRIVTSDAHTETTVTNVIEAVCFTYMPLFTF